MLGLDRSVSEGILRARDSGQRLASNHRNLQCVQPSTGGWLTLLRSAWLDERASVRL